MHKLIVDDGRIDSPLMEVVLSLEVQILALWMVGICTEAYLSWSGRYGYSSFGEFLCVHSETCVVVALLSNAAILL